jgi:hypothetical protein
MRPGLVAEQELDDSRAKDQDAAAKIDVARSALDAAREQLGISKADHQRIASSLHRHYPASSVLQASPPPQTARPVSRELPVDPTAITAGASRVAFSPLCLHAVATTPAGWRKLFAHTLPPHRPSPSPRRVGSCILNFEACSAFTHVTACTLAGSLLRPYSTGGFSGFVTSTAAPIATGRNEPAPGWDLHPLWTKRLFTAHADHPIKVPGPYSQSQAYPDRRMHRTGDKMPPRRTRLWATHPTRQP